MSGSKKRRAPKVILGILLIIIVVLPLIAVVSSFIGKITPDSVIPDSFDLYASVPNPLQLAERVLNHESLPEIMALAELEPLLVTLGQLKDSGLTENKLIRFAARGQLDAAFLSGERILAAWDLGIFSPVLRLLPYLAGRITVPGLYYVQAGKNSRFEYRLEDGTVFFIGPHKNLLVISNNSVLFESVLNGSSRTGDRIGSGAKAFYSSDHDIAFLLSPAALQKYLGGSDTDPQVLSALTLLQFPGPVEASLSVLPNQLKLRIATPLDTGNEALRKIIEKNSRAVQLSAMVPDSAQYLTLLSAGSLKELLDAVLAIGEGNSYGADLESTLRKADSTARTALRMNMDELLFSWSGSQFAVYGLEGRPNPVIAVEIKDEKKRKEVFDKAFKSIFLNEDVRLNLDGNRIPRIQVPAFLNALLVLLGVNVPSPYYTVQNNYLLISESAETLLAAVNAVRRNEVLPRTDLWHTLSEDNSGPSSFNLFYSLDRSLPFFLKGNSAATAILRLYRQGMARIQLEDKVFRVSLFVIPGAGKGTVPLTGYPVELGGRAGNRVARISDGKDTRLVLTRGTDALVINPLTRSIVELKDAGSSGVSLYAIPFASGDTASGSGEAAIWIADSQGHVNLTNKDLESQRNFPNSTGIRLSAPPFSHGGKLFLCAEDGSIHTVDSKAVVTKWGKSFSSALRSPPSFIDFSNKTYTAVYPKSIVFGEIFLLDAAGAPLPGWPVPVSEIAFGSPLLFSSKGNLLAAFITQAGELSVYNENAELLPGFPLQLHGVFYLQPVFDGENLWLIESEGSLFRISLNGEIFSQKIARLSVREEGYITRAEANGETGIFFTGEGNALYGYSQNFNSLDGFPLPVWGRPYIGDLNNDKKTEVAGVSMDSRLYMWQFR